ncbi:MAG: GTP-binding protein, partial [Candidatus Aminicenantes bacterium]|nr:GTP-binding protein [Candidatus Aminicenantes bacterium]
SIPGTTRDFIREKIFIEGYPVELMDVAGINSGSVDDIEKLGISRSIDLVKDSDAVIFLLDGSTDIDDNDRSIYDLIKEKEQIIFINKSDNLKDGVIESVSEEFNSSKVFQLSVLNNTGMEKVYEFISSIINEIGEDKAEISVNLRQKNLLVEISDSLINVKRMIKAGKTDIELTAEEVRTCVTNIGRLLGEVTNEDILGKIFSNFCVGK